MSAAVLVLVLGMPRDMGTSSGAPPDSRTLHAAELTHRRQRPACRLLVRKGKPRGDTRRWPENPGNRVRMK